MAEAADSSLATLIVGLGNPLRGDDGVGVRVAELLAGQALPDGVEVVDGGTLGLGLVTLMEGRQRLILVDAADVGREPGQFVRFTLDEVRLGGAGLQGKDLHLSIHGAGLRDALLLAQTLQVLPDEVVVFGVQPASLEWESGLSPEVEAALPGLIRAVLAELPDNRSLDRLELFRPDRSQEQICREIGLPRVKPGVESGSSRTCQVWTDGRKATMANERILVVDDDPDLVEVMRLTLEAADYQVFSASSGVEGLEKVKEIDPDLIILDVMMDYTTEGFQVSLNLRSPDPDSEYAAYRHIPILMLTALHSTTPLRFRPDEDYLPVDDFVEKPLEPGALVEKVKELLAK